MMTVKTLDSVKQARSYYQAERGIASYYSSEAGAYGGGQWYGRGAEELGLRGPVHERQWNRALEGKFGKGPDAMQVGNSDPEKRRPGVDLQFAPPKSVSIMALAVGDDRLIGAHDRAVERTMARIQDEQVFARMKHGGSQKVLTGNLAAALYRHATDRPVNGVVDPQLHTHAVVLNVTQRPDGQWVSINLGMSRDWIKAYGAIYRMELAKEVRALGYELYETKDGFEIKGISREIIEMFSGRDGQIRGYLWEKYGETRETASTAHKQEANLATRHGKEKRDGAELRAEWRARAEAVGLSMSASGKQASRTQAGGPSPAGAGPRDEGHDESREGRGRFRGDLDFDPRAKIAPGVTRVQAEMAERTEERAVGIRRSPEQLERAREEAVQRASARVVIEDKDYATGTIPPQGPPGAPVAGAGAGDGGALDQIYADAVARGPLPPPDPATVRAIATEGVQAAVRHLSERESAFERDAILVAAQGFLPAGLVDAHDLERAVAREVESCRLLDATGGRYTTAEAIVREQEFIERIQDGRDAVPPIANDTPAVLQTSDGKTLNTGQTNAAKHILETPDRFVAVQGVAGAGKTTAMQVVREHAEAAGYQVVGLAPTKKSVHELREAGVADTYTVARAVTRMPDHVGERTLVIVDEASMIGAADMAELTEKIEACGARVVIMGDKRQLPAIPAGAPFRQMQDHSATATLDEIQRQRNLDLKACVEAFAAGRAGDGANLARSFMHEADFSSLEGQHFTNITAEHAAKASIIAQEAADRFLQRLPEERKDIVVITGTNKMRKEINMDIREGLKESGEIAAHDRELKILEKQDFTDEQIRHAGSYEKGQVVEFRRDYLSHGVSVPVERGRQYEITGIDRDHNKVALVDRESGHKLEWSPQIAQKVDVSNKAEIALSEGDRVLFRANNQDRGILNGDAATVLQTQGDKITVALDRGGAVLELRDGDHLQHAYASTVHSVQSISRDGAIGAFPSWSPLATAEQGYVPLSRARDWAEMVTDSKAALAGAWSQWNGKETAHEVRLDDRDHDLDKVAPQPDRAADRAREDENAGWKPRTEPEREHERTHESRSHDLGRSR